MRLYKHRQKIWLNYENYPCSDNFDRFKAVNFSAFDCLLDRYNKYIERKILGGPNKSPLHRLLHSTLKRPKRIPPLKDEAGSSAPTDSFKASFLAQYFQKSCSENASDYNSYNDTSISVMEPRVWFYKDEIYNELCALPAAYTVIPDEVPPYFIKKVAIAISYL